VLLRHAPDSELLSGKYCLDRLLDPGTFSEHGFPFLGTHVVQINVNG